MFKTVSLKPMISGVLSLIFVGLVLVFSSEAKFGVSSGLSLCYKAVVPSLFLFTAIMLFCFSVGVTKSFGKVLNPIAKVVFNLSGEQLAVVLMSLFAGYPVGARLISQLYVSGKVDIYTSRRMLNFCINAGPAFILVTVGEVMLGSRSDGIRLLTVHIFVSLITAVISGIFSRFKIKAVENSKEIQSPKLSDSSIAEIFVNSVTAAAKTMLTVCSFVVIFAGIGSIFDSLPLPADLKHLARSLLEVTVGVSNLGRGNLPKIAFLLGFSGVSVIFQVLASAKDIKPPLLSLFIGRVWHGALSSGLIILLEKLFPRSIDTVVFGQKPASMDLNGSPIAFLSLIFLSIVLICSTNFSFKGRNLKQNVVN